MHTLKNNNQAFDLRTSAKCGAKTKDGHPCQAPAIRNKKGIYTRCRIHGGASTGPVTVAGKEKCSKARMKHGKYSKLAKEKNTFPKVIVGTQKLIKQRKEIMGELKKVVPSEHKNEILLYYKSLIASHSGDEGVLIDKQNKITDLLKSNLLENPNELSIREKITILKVASKENSYKHHSSLKEFSDFRNDLMHYEEILKGHLQNTQAKGESQK